VAAVAVASGVLVPEQLGRLQAVNVDHAVPSQVGRLVRDGGRGGLQRGRRGGIRRSIDKILARGRGCCDKREGTHVVHV
jgi:hypothetical protein